MGIQAEQLPAKPRILIVDDDPGILQLLILTLRDEGYDINTLTDASRALETYHDFQPDLVLLDVMMPEVSGLDICKRIKQTPGGMVVPVMILTALAGLESKLRGLDAGADDYVSKPFNRSEFKARVANLLKIRRQHQELLRSYNELRKLQEVRDTLTSLLVHDLKTPLAGILANAQYIRDVSRDGEITGCAENIDSSANAVLSMIANLLDIARMEEGKLEPARERIRVLDLVRGCLAHQTRVFTLKEISHDTSAIPQDLFWTVDPQLSCRILQNLIGNALRYAPRNSVIEVGARQTGDTLELAVRDWGPGIPEGYHAAIFDKYAQVGDTTAVPRYERGLGLYFCKLAMEAQGGSIRVARPLNGAGTEFVMQFPSRNGG
ncbi:MAG: Sensor histidine kinase RcsC [Myxococcota bacterium]|nr:Sensor histidine kinase RcsC [Myxococcota bacterium]